MQPTNQAHSSDAILLVDDDDLYVRATTRLLRSLGYPLIFRAPSADVALEMLGRVEPTFVFTDMAMEHKSAGREVIAACQRLGIQVAVISGLPGLNAEELGCGFCPKSDLSSSALARLLDDMFHAASDRVSQTLRIEPLPYLPSARRAG